MATSFTSVHGTNVVLSYGSSFEIRAMEGYARIRPKDSAKLTGSIQFSIPRPAAGNRNCAHIVPR
ncbi:hypothetical protein RRF57_007869 [Xylaria bambusicola]|uniref:Uncharacterized protein n=1 Tax=Xylaria bambusicola TaxID=326684 RepID=A0AAN7UGV0_9PEZI